jgi:endonuclease G
VLQEEIEDIKLAAIIKSLQSAGLPSDDYVTHGGMILSFDSDIHQARWVSHIILPEIAEGTVSRTNDFRDDPLVEGEAIEEDYFLKELQEDNSYVYDGFGYDRGHLAPSADFRWSRKALSESYYYSNMSPQHGDFNREDWAELEAILRGYVINNTAALYVVTMPIIKDGHERIERGTHKLAIPQEFLKVAFDAENGRGVAFLMESVKKDNDIADYAISIDRAEELTGLDFFSILDDQYPGLEDEFDISAWFPESTSQGVEPIYAPSLSEGHINTTQAKRWMGSTKKVHVCGTVVSTRFSGSGNYWLNIDKKFPNTVFSVYVRKTDFVNFDSITKEYLMNEKVCFYGKVTEMFSQPNMNIVRQEQVVHME